MRVLIISDSHGKTDNIELLKRKEEHFDLILHCGDGSAEYDFISDFLHAPLTGVRGNCDLFSRELSSVNLDIEGKKVHIEHGNRLPVYSDSELLDFAENNGYDLVLFGHTHVQKKLERRGHIVINPGSISRPRDGFPSYTVMNTDGKGSFSFIEKRL